MEVLPDASTYHSQDGSILEGSVQSLDSGLFSTRGDDSESPDEEKETYYFESDHVSLKGNHDYQIMLRTIALLEAQRIQAVKDLDQLFKAEEEALANPIQFVEKLQRRVDLKLPRQQKVVELPDIAWEKYTSQLDLSSFGSHRHKTRLKQQHEKGNNSEESSNVTMQQNDLTLSDELVRGRIKTEKKPETFNQLWTATEQQKLEELLLQYPPEEIEAQRWKKIAMALGNRTPLQVQSRVQKYFIKLAKAGLPIPGRPPNLGMYRKKYRYKNKYRRYYNSSTFLTSFTPPVYMSDDDDDDDDDDNSQSYEESLTSNIDAWDFKEESVSDDDSVPPELRNTTEYQELLHLKKLRKKFQTDTPQLAEHIGFKCDRCDCEPIVGTRWHCLDCPADITVDFCDDCVDSSYEIGNHNSSHRLKPKSSTNCSEYRDTDYLGFVPGGTCSGYNYLDPNYMPAS